jgi:hypothetical protein
VPTYSDFRDRFLEFYKAVTVLMTGTGRRMTVGLVISAVFDFMRTYLTFPAHLLHSYLASQRIFNYCAGKKGCPNNGHSCVSHATSQENKCFFFSRTLSTK